MIIFTIKESENKELESSSIIHLYCEIIIKPKKKKSWNLLLPFNIIIPS